MIARNKTKDEPNNNKNNKSKSKALLEENELLKMVGNQREV
jgi:hypothetical protein